MTKRARRNHNPALEAKVALAAIKVEKTAHGFVYLAAVLDWFSRRVLSWRISITLAVEFCLEAVEEALARHGRPDISARCGALS